MRKILNAELQRPTPEEFLAQSKLPIVVVLDNIRSINNIGAFFRTADAFSIERIILCGICATPPNREIHKTALGAEMTIPWSYYASTLEAVAALKEQGYSPWAIEQVEGAVMLDQLRVNRSMGYALIFGNEVNGVAQEVVDGCEGAIEIPQGGTKHSLNVAVSGGAVLWEFFKQWKDL